LLTERRQVEKLLTTYLNPIPKLANHWDDGKVRFHLNPLGARTGRFTSGGDWRFYENETPVKLPGMNAQNLPAENHEIRLMFKAEPGRTFVGGDISQQEPKITAHISLDENMLQVYEEGKDIYASVAQSIYKNNYEDNLEFYEMINAEFDPGSEFTQKRRDALKHYFLCIYFADKLGKECSDKELGKNVTYNIDTTGIAKTDVDDLMGRLRNAARKVVGGKFYGSDIFYIESCVYLMTLYDLLTSGYKVWLLYDAFYAQGAADQETFEKMISNGVRLNFKYFMEHSGDMFK